MAAGARCPHDNTVAPALLDDTANVVLLGDNAFADPELQHWRQEARQIQVVAAPRRSAKQRWPSALHQRFTRLRRRIETVLRGLCTVFQLEAVGSRSLN